MGGRCRGPCRLSLLLGRPSLDVALAIGQRHLVSPAMGAAASARRKHTKLNALALLLTRTFGSPSPEQHAHSQLRCTSQSRRPASGSFLGIFPVLLSELSKFAARGGMFGIHAGDVGCGGNNFLHHAWNLKRSSSLLRRWSVRFEAGQSIMCLVTMIYNRSVVGSTSGQRCLGKCWYSHG